jgi:hypothetical protein
MDLDEGLQGTNFRNHETGVFQAAWAVFHLQHPEVLRAYWIGQNRRWGRGGGVPGGELYGRPGKQSPRGGKIGRKMHILNENICISALNKNC